MTLYILSIFAVLCLTKGYRQDYDFHDMINEEENDHRAHYVEHHKYPPYYFSHKYFPAFSSWMMEKDEIYQHDFMDSFDDTDEDEDEEEEEKYSDKSQLTAFLLAFFLGYLGVGRFYVGQTVSAVFKLILGLIACCPWKCLYCRLTGREYNAGFSFNSRSIDDPLEFIQGCVFCGSLGAFIWWLIDVILFGINDIEDGDRLPLKPW